jgi:hypothetical protein
LVGRQQFSEMPPYFRGIEVKGQPDAPRVFFEPPPVSFVCKRLALKNPHCREQPPPVQEPRLAWRKPRLVDGNYPVIMRNQPMDQMNLARNILGSAPYSNPLRPGDGDLAGKSVTKKARN